MRILFALVIVLLFSGCVSIVNLLFARVRAQEHEAAIRVALGSSRTRVIANRVTETLLLVGAGGLLSLPLAIWEQSYAGSVFALLTVSSISVCLPAFRAGNIDPASILRSE